MDKKLLIEKIETKIEELKESELDLEPNDYDGAWAIGGLVDGLKMALDIINE